MDIRYTSTTTAELRAEGVTRALLASMVARGVYIRPRRGVFVDSGTPDQIVRAVRVGGLLTCLSVLEMLGVFVQKNDRLHVHLRRAASRMRSPHDRKKRLQPRATRRVILHWRPLIEPAELGATCVGIVDALAHAVICQAPRAAVATLDSALHLGFVTDVQLREVFRALPAKYRPLLPLVDGRAESGPETLVRLMLRALGCVIELQVEFAGVGRVDLLVDGWLVIECDSRAHHSDWAKHEDDRRRDSQLAAWGYTTLRVTATAIMDRPDEVLAAIRGLLGARAALVGSR